MGFHALGNKHIKYDRKKKHIKNFGLERDYFFHIPINLTQVLPWDLKRGCGVTSWNNILSVT